MDGVAEEPPYPQDPKAWSSSMAFDFENLEVLSGFGAAFAAAS